MVRETKLYDLLGVSPSANENEIKKAYRKAALKYHPDKPTGDTEKFKEISEAFDILSSEDKRQVYDDYGLEAARGNAPAGGAGGNPFAGAGGAGGNPFGGFGGAGGHGFSQNDAFNIFSQMGGFGMGGGDDFGGFSSFGGGGMPGGFGQNSGFGGSRRRGPEPDTVTMALPVSLEDLFTGATKKMKLNRKNQSGMRDSKVLEIKLRPGWKAGTKITFANEGDYQPECQARQTIQFVLEEKPHPVFKRQDNDLLMTLPISFKDSLLGFEKDITTIDGRKIPFSRSSPVQPHTSTTYPGLGMPLSKSPGQRGDLIINFKVDYPLSLNPAQKEAIARNF